jgi:hypothetical protein
MLFLLYSVTVLFCWSITRHSSSAIVNNSHSFFGPRSLTYVSVPERETNTTQNDSVQFLIFGALLIPMENAAGTVEGVIRIRERAGYPVGTEFKFDTRSRPDAVSKEKFDEAKGAV